MICFKAVSSGFELLPQLAMIVDLAVKGDHQLFVHGGHRLRSGRDIEDRQASVAKKDLAILIDPGSFAVRTTMGEHIDHSMQDSVVSLSDESGDTAHGQRLAFNIQRSTFGV